MAATLPRPFLAHLIHQAEHYGWRRAVVIACVPLLTDGIAFIMVILLLLQLPPWFAALIRLVGAFFLLYWAWEAGHYVYRRTLSAGDRPGSRAGLGQAVAMSLLSVTTYVVLITMHGPLFLEAWRLNPAWGPAYLGIGYGVYLVILQVISAIASVVRTPQPRLGRVLAMLAIAAAVGMSAVQLWAGSRAFAARFL